MWLLGIEKAFPILTEARRYNPQEALRVGIIDELANNEKALLCKAKDWLLGNQDQRRPWDRNDPEVRWTQTDRFSRHRLQASTREGAARAH